MDNWLWNNSTYGKKKELKKFFIETLFSRKSNLIFESNLNLNLTSLNLNSGLVSDK